MLSPEEFKILSIRRAIEDEMPDSDDSYLVKYAKNTLRRQGKRYLIIMCMELDIFPGQDYPAYMEHSKGVLVSFIEPHLLNRSLRENLSSPNSKILFSQACERFQRYKGRVRPTEVF